MEGVVDGASDQPDETEINSSPTRGIGSEQASSGALRRAGNGKSCRADYIKVIRSGSWPEAASSE